MSTSKKSGNGPEPLTVAQERLKVAISRSKAGLIFDTHQRLRYVRDALYRDYPELSDRIADVKRGDVTASDARTEMREVMQLIDAELETSI